MKKLFSIFLATVILFSSSVQVLAKNDEVSQNDSFSSDHLMRESYALEHGTMFLEETADYRIVFIEYDYGSISYSICYKSNPGIAYTGKISMGDVETVEQRNKRISRGEFPGYTNVLLSIDSDNVIDFASRSEPKATILTESAALAFASSYAPGWKTPVSSKLIGTYYASGLTVSVRETVKGIATRDNIVNYYIGDTLVSLISVVFQLSLSKVIKVITNIYNAAGDYIAQKNGTLTYFTVDNTRTKVAKISGQIYYWAGWDRIYCVYSGDKKTFTELTYNMKHSDYDNSVSYFGEKAIYNYNNGY